MFYNVNVFWKCVTCNNRSALKCSHGRISNLPEVKNTVVVVKNKNQTFNENLLLTKGLIQLPLLQSIFIERKINLLSTIGSQFNHVDYSKPVKVISEKNLCSNCGDILHEKLKNNGIIVLSVLIKCEVYIKYCQACPYEEISWTECSTGYINYNNKLIIGVEMVVEYMDLFSSSGCPFLSWWTAKFHESNSKCSSDIVDSATNWKNYISILHRVFVISTEKFVFLQDIPKCCQNPKVISMDGHVASVRSDKMNKQKTPWITESIKKNCLLDQRDNSLYYHLVILTYSRKQS